LASLLFASLHFSSCCITSLLSASGWLNFMYHIHRLLACFQLGNQQQLFQEDDEIKVLYSSHFPSQEPSMRRCVFAQN
jgi:hypothetical protein